MDAERGVQREWERWRGTMFLNRLAMITESEGPVLMTYSWTLLAPHSPREYTKQMQERKREGWGGGKMQRQGGAMWDGGEKQCDRTVVKRCREGGRVKLCIKRQTQKQDEREEMGCGWGTDGESTHSGDHFLTFVSVLGHRRGAAEGLTGWLSRWQTVGLNHYAHFHLYLSPREKVEVVFYAGIYLILLLNLWVCSLTKKWTGFNF